VSTALRRPGVLLVVLAVALIGGLDAVEEYFPVLAGEWGVATEAVPLAVLVVSLAGAAGAALGGRADRLRGGTLLALLVLAAGCLAVAAVWARPAALLVVAVFYGLYLAVLVVAESRLQARIASAHRATITSVAGLGIELAALLVFAAWAIAGPIAVAALVLAVVPVVRAGLRTRETV
jgi:predicted MFS family arabinose efflux permease